MTDEQIKNEKTEEVGQEKATEEKGEGQDEGKTEFKKEKQGLFHRECKNCEKLKTQCEEYKVGWQRAVADYKNLRKEIQERQSQWIEMSELQILEEFIPVYDHFKLAFRLLTLDFSSEQQKWVDGIKHIMKQFGDILKAHKIEEIKTVGEKFDPKFHEAVAYEPAPQGEAVQGALESGTIVREVEGGYTMGGRVVKAAKVIVAK